MPNICHGTYDNVLFHYTVVRDGITETLDIPIGVFPEGRRSPSFTVTVVVSPSPADKPESWRLRWYETLPASYPSPQGSCTPV